MKPSSGERARREHVQVGHLAGGQGHDLGSRGRRAGRRSDRRACRRAARSAVRGDDGGHARTRPARAGAPRAWRRLPPRRRLGLALLGVDHELGRGRLLVGVVNAREPLDLALEGLLVQALDVSARAHSSTDALTNTSTKAPHSSTILRALRRVSSYGEIAAAITAPWRVRRDATQPIRSMFVSRSSFEKPRPFERRVRTVSPSRYSTTWPRRSSSGRRVRDRGLAGARQAGEPEREAALAAGHPTRGGRGRRCVQSLDSLIRGALPWMPHQLPRAGPAPGPLVFARPDGARARDAADGGVTDVVQWVVRPR